MSGSDNAQIAEQTRRACLDAVVRAYEEAKLRGMCGEGAWGFALDAIRKLDLGDHEGPNQTCL